MEPYFDYIPQDIIVEISGNQMDSCFDFIPQDLIIEILGYLDLQSAFGLSHLKSIHVIYESKDIWSYLLSRDYPHLYKAIKTIKEDTIENMRMLYYTYKDNIKYRNLIEKYDTLKFDISMWKPNTNIFKACLFKELTMFPILLKMLIYINYPGNYNRLKDIMNLDTPQKFNLESVQIKIMFSLKYASQIPMKDDVINKYLKGEKYNYPPMNELYGMRNHPSNNDFGIYWTENYAFIWLYVTDPNIDINDDLEIGDLLYWIYKLSKEFNRREEFNKVLGKLTPINMLEAKRMLRDEQDFHDLLI